MKQQQSFFSGIAGLILLLPASYFMLTLTARVFGARAPYCFIAPSFLQSPFHLLAFHKAQIILISLFLAVIANVQFRRHWLNAAVAFQSTLLLILLLGYTIIQHLRY